MLNISDATVGVDTDSASCCARSLARLPRICAWAYIRPNEDADSLRSCGYVEKNSKASTGDLKIDRGGVVLPVPESEQVSSPCARCTTPLHITSRVEPNKVIFRPDDRAEVRYEFNDEVNAGISRPSYSPLI